MTAREREARQRRKEATRRFFLQPKQTFELPHTRGNAIKSITMHECARGVLIRAFSVSSKRRLQLSASES